jgi:hypothetical protein
VGAEGDGVGDGAGLDGVGGLVMSLSLPLGFWLCVGILGSCDAMVSPPFLSSGPLTELSPLGTIPDQRMEPGREGLSCLSAYRWHWKSLGPG